MSNKSITADVALQAVEENANRHRQRWSFKSAGSQFGGNSEKFVTLAVEELGEYVRAVLDNDDLPALELIQLGGLVLNALRSLYTEEEVIVAWCEEAKRHPL